MRGYASISEVDNAEHQEGSGINFAGFVHCRWRRRPPCIFSDIPDPNTGQKEPDRTCRLGQMIEISACSGKRPEPTSSTRKHSS